MGMEYCKQKPITKARIYNTQFVCCICQQPGHKAEMCPNGQVDWVAKLGNRAFLLRHPVYWSDDPANRQNLRTAAAKLEKLEIATQEHIKKVCKEQQFGYEGLFGT